MRRIVKRRPLIAAVIISLITLFFISARIESVARVAAEKLSVNQARRAIARTAGIELPTDAVKVEKTGISVRGSSATVEATVKTAFRLRQNAKGDWEVAEIRVGDRRWEDVALLRQSLDREKTERARAELETLRVALEAFRRERGHYPPVMTTRELADHLAPRYLSQVLRLDPWSEPYDYTGTSTSYRLRAIGADRTANTADDIIFNSNE
jgi:hypothetical protein